jgi:hypothetical protein
MKKLLFILAIVAVYGLSATTAKASAVVSGKAGVTVVAGDNCPDDKKADSKQSDVKKDSSCTDKKAEAGCAGKSEASGCCAKAKSSGCAEAKGCGSQKEEAAVPAKK